MVLSLALRSPDAWWSAPSHGESIEHLVDRRLKQEQVNRFQPQTVAGGVSRTHGSPPPGPFPHPGAFQSQYLDESFLLLIPCLVSLSLLTPTKDWNWLSAWGLATVIAAFVNKLRIYRNPLFGVFTLCTWEQSNGSAGNPWLRMHKRANE